MSDLMSERMAGWRWLALMVVLAAVVLERKMRGGKHSRQVTQLDYKERVNKGGLYFVANQRFELGDICMVPQRAHYCFRTATEIITCQPPKRNMMVHQLLRMGVHR
jgi:hypothetical protein